MPIRINERKPRTFSVTKPRTIGDKARGGGQTARPEQKQYINKVKRQQRPDPAGHQSWKAPSDPSHHQAPVAERDSMNKSYADHFFQISRGHNNGSVDPHYHHKQQIDRNQYFPRPRF